MGQNHREPEAFHLFCVCVCYNFGKYGEGVIDSGAPDSDRVPKVGTPSFST